MSELASGSLYVWGDNFGRIVIKIGGGPAHGIPCVQLHVVEARGETFIDHRSYDVFDGDVILVDTSGANIASG